MAKLQIVLPGVLLVALTLACGSYAPRATPVVTAAATSTAEPTVAPVILIPTDTPAPVRVEPVIIEQPTDTPVVVEVVEPTAVPVLETDTPFVVATVPAVAVCDCSGNTLNCGDFASGSEAHACYDYCMATVGSDVHQLDRDGDGLMCESQ